MNCIEEIEVSVSQTCAARRLVILEASSGAAGIGALLTK